MLDGIFVPVHHVRLERPTVGSGHSKQLEARPTAQNGIAGAALILIGLGCILSGSCGGPKVQLGPFCFGHVHMGGEPSKDVQERVARQEEKLKQDFELSKEALRELDQQTRVPHLLLEIRSMGFVEIQGKDTGGIYQRLDQWLKEHWKMQEKQEDLIQVCKEEADCGCCGYSTTTKVCKMEEHHRLCDKSYTMGPMRPSGIPARRHEVYKARDDGESFDCLDRENNMGKLTMQLAHFMTQECGWTLQVCDAANLGRCGNIREQQMKFKAPHPLSMIAPLVMIELHLGFPDPLGIRETKSNIYVNGVDSDGVFEKLRSFFRTAWVAKEKDADPSYCNMKFETHTLQTRGVQGENNMGQKAMQVVDFMVKKCQWSLVSRSNGNFGKNGEMRESQMVFRKDEFIQHGSDHIMVEFRTVGYVEITGLHDAEDLKPHLAEYFERQKCKKYSSYPSESFCDLKYKVPSGFFVGARATLNLGKLTMSLADFLGSQGWALALSNGSQGEHQVTFTRSSEKASAPLLMIEFRTIPFSGLDSAPKWHSAVQISGPDTNGVYGHLDRFIRKYMQGREETHPGSYCDKLYMCNAFRLKPASLDEFQMGMVNGESDLGKWAMRFCDFMVDHVGAWDLVTCNSDNKMDVGSNVTAREMQMIFRHRPGGRQVFMSVGQVEPLGRPPLEPPPYWHEGCLTGEVGQKLMPGTQEELQWMQELLDKTFKNKVTRDRKDGHALADRFVAVQCIRSEHPAIWDRFAERRQLLSRAGGSEDFILPKTMAASAGLAQRCVEVSRGNPSNEAYLLHGTNPTSAVAILSNSFTVDFAGKSAGTMFGPGIYLAESSTKADEYAQDDATGDYAGLYAVLVCRALLGKPYVTQEPGDFREQVLSGEFGHVLGDREKAVGTFREFIFFHAAAVYPEYAVFYRREKDGRVMARPESEMAPRPMEMEGWGGSA
ncbi:Poly(ADP-ribose) polymerase pme-5 [Symbiodinium microadriaticum]|uniref:Poly [ADP-ribose] polymerase n=1 Tax=Symbiodinium microadriaticum TaxID=2951 RepID=A0A1Q9D1S1_SYMMI|nr:Poly(ADP-ribose) polymerase pme-5 [Symbiodinium microadriaticum]